MLILNKGKIREWQKETTRQTTLDEEAMRVHSESEFERWQNERNKPNTG